MPLPPGLQGFALARAQGNNEQLQQMQLLNGLMHAQAQMQQQQQQAQMQPLQMQALQAKIDAQKRAEQLNAALAPLLNGGQVPPDVLDMLGTKLAMEGHPGAATVMNIADKRRQAGQNAQAIQGMQSSPGVTPATPNDDEGNPMPVVPPQPGIASGLMQSKYVGPQAAALQGLINQGAPGMNPQQIQSHLDRLTQMHVSGQARDDTQKAIDSRQTKAQDFKIDFRGMYPPGGGAEHSPYTNVQSDGKGGFVGLNKRTMRMEQIPTAPGVTMGGYGQVAPGNEKLTGKAFLDTLSTDDQEIVKAVAEGRTKVTDLSIRGGHREQIIKMANRYMQGFDSVASSANAASYNKLVQQYDAVTSFEKNAIRNGEVMVKLAEKVDTTGVPVIERWIRAGRRAVAGDPDVSAFNTQLQVFRTEAARILTNPNLSGQLTDNARKEVEHFLPETASAEQVKRVFSLLKNDFEGRRRTLEEQMDDNRQRGRVSKGIPTSTPSTAPSTAPSRPPLSSFNR